MFGPLLEVQMSKKWHAAVGAKRIFKSKWRKKAKKGGPGATGWSADAQKLHTVAHYEVDMYKDK